MFFEPQDIDHIDHLHFLIDYQIDHFNHHSSLPHRQSYPSSFWHARALVGTREARVIVGTREVRS
jgi:hypothetical protein